jgi:hypothetical protein
MNYGYVDYQAWCKEVDTELNKKKEELNKNKEAVKNTFEEAMDEYRQNHGNLWYCSSVDTWASLEITTIPSLDNVNNLVLIQPINVNQTNQECMITLLKSNKDQITVDEYHQKYCRKFDDKWIYTSILDLKYDNEADEETEEESDTSSVQSESSDPHAVIDSSLDFDNLD